MIGSFTTTQKQADVSQCLSLHPTGQALVSVVTKRLKMFPSSMLMLLLLPLTPCLGLTKPGGSPKGLGRGKVRKQHAVREPEFSNPY
jgi:hypothetical protein